MSDILSTIGTIGTPGLCAIIAALVYDRERMRAELAKAREDAVLSATKTAELLEKAISHDGGAE